MKKRFMNALLFGALAFASTSTFVSCKDYDDDINNLQTQIDKLATADQLSAKVSEMQAAIAAAQSTAEAKAAAAQSVAEAAQKAADSAKSAADAAAKKAEELEKNGATKAEVEAAQKAAEAAKAAAEAADKNAADAIAQVKKDLEAAASAAAEAVKAAQEAADKANADVTAALERLAKLEAEGATKTEVEAAKADAKKAQETADKAVADAQAAATAAADAAAKAATAQSGVDAVKLAIEAVKGDVATQQTSLSTINTELEGIKTVLKAAGLDPESTEAGISDLQTRVNKLEKDLKAIIGEYTSMVTSVDLFIGQYQGAYRNNIPDNNLQFIFVPQEKTVKFPLNEDVADAQIEFSAENKNVTTTDSLVIRVSPTNAVLNPENISLITSQGKELSEYVEVKSVKRFNTLQTSPVKTRATADDGNGLWTVEFAVKEGVDLAKLAEEVAVKRGNYTYAIEYAVAVKNTENADTRRVISEYSVEVQPSDYEPATDKVLVENRDGVWKDIDNVRNRFYCYGDDDFGAYSLETNKREKKVTEYKWQKLTEPQIEGTTTGIELDKSDARSIRNLVEVSLGQDININVASFLNATTQLPDDMNGNEGGNGYYSDARGYAVKGFYVTLDKNFAIESAPSEWNAWKNYEYTNVGVEGKAKAKLFTGKQGYISINDEDALGDIIGFRVYVVNLDGSLVDPDGRAFYVHVGEQKSEGTLVTAVDPVSVKLTGDDAKDMFKYAGHFGGNNKFLSEPTEITENIFADLEYVSDNNFGYLNENGVKVWGWQVTVNPSAYGNNAVVPVYGTDYKVIYLNKDKQITTKVEDIKYAQVQILNPQMFLDDAAYTVRTTLIGSNNIEIRDIKLSFTKVMPTADDIAPLAWVSTFDPTKQVFTNTAWENNDIYKISLGGNVQAVRLYDKMTNLSYGTGTENDQYKQSWYTLAFQNIEANKESKNNPNVQLMGANVSENKVVDTATPGHDSETWSAGAWTSYYLNVIKDDIDNESHKINYMYDFGRISLQFNYETAEYERPNTYILTSEKDLAMTFNSWIDFEEIGWGKKPELIYHAGATGSSASFQIGDYTTTKDVDDVQPVVYKYTLSGKAAKAPVFYYEETNGNKIYTAVVNREPYINAEGKTVNPVDTIYVNYTEGDKEATLKTPETKFSKADLEEMKFKTYEKQLTYVAGTIPSNTTIAAKYPLNAWNTVLRNYIGSTAVFGEASKPVQFTSLAGYGSYIGLTTPDAVSFEPASLYDVSYNYETCTLTFTQKTYSANPTTKGTLKITGYDCFGHKKTWSVEVAIKQ